MLEEKLALQAEKKRGPEINDFTVSRRIRELREAQKQLSSEGKDYELTSKEVIEKAAENRVKRAEQLRRPVTEMLQAQKVYSEETGIEPKANENPPLYRSTAVMARLQQLKAAREALGKDGENLSLDDMKVIQQDYKTRRIDPLKNGIVDIDTLTDAQRKEYTERMQAVDFLTNVRGVKDLHPNASRYHARVENVLGNLRKARADYETFVEGAEKDLSLRDPKIMAMHMYNMSSLDPKFAQKVSFDDVAKLAQNIQGKTYDQAQAAAKQQIREIQIRDQHPQIEAQPYQRQGP
jgi:hypothetical protein